MSSSLLPRNPTETKAFLGSLPACGNGSETAAETPVAGLVHHVTMYVGSGEMIEAPRTGDVTKIDPVRSTEYYGARR